MIYIVFAIGLIATGLLLSRYELRKAKRDRLRDRAERCVRSVRVD